METQGSLKNTLVYTHTHTHTHTQRFLNLTNFLIFSGSLRIEKQVTNLKVCRLYKLNTGNFLQFLSYTISRDHILGVSMHQYPSEVHPKALNKLNCKFQFYLDHDQETTNEPLRLLKADIRGIYARVCIIVQKQVKPYKPRIINKIVTW